MWFDYTSRMSCRAHRFIPKCEVGTSIIRTTKTCFALPLVGSEAGHRRRNADTLFETLAYERCTFDAIDMLNDFLPDWVWLRE